MTFNVQMDKLFEHLQKASPVVVAITIVTGAILFLPESLRGKLYISNISEQWLQIIGIIFLFSAFLIITIICQMVISSISRKMKNHQQLKRLMKQYETLDARQKGIISELLHSEEKSIVLDMYDGDAQYLTSLGFIFGPQQPVTLDWNDKLYVKFLPKPWLLNLYNQNPNRF